MIKLKMSNKLIPVLRRSIPGATLERPRQGIWFRIEKKESDTETEKNLRRLKFELLYYLKRTRSIQNWTPKSDM